jgi:hypothetical protein
MPHSSGAAGVSPAVEPGILPGILPNATRIFFALSQRDYVKIAQSFSFG